MTTTVMTRRIRTAMSSTKTFKNESGFVRVNRDSPHTTNNNRQNASTTPRLSDVGR